MIQGTGSERLPVAGIPRGPVESSRRGGRAKLLVDAGPEPRDAMDARSSSCAVAIPWAAGH
jgi:hypothetical protein